MYASQFPSGENWGFFSAAWVFTRTVGVPGFQPGGLVPFHRENPDVRIGALTCLLKRQELAAWMPGPGNLSQRAVGEALHVAGQVST